MPVIGIKMSSLNLLENEHYVLNGPMYDVIANVRFHIKSTNGVGQGNVTLKILKSIIFQKYIPYIWFKFIVPSPDFAQAYKGSQNA